jgi:hypothetical protein
MKGRSNKYIFLILIGILVFAAGFRRVQQITVTAHAKAVSSAHGPKYKDAVIAHRFHQNHFKRHRFNLDGWLPVQQDTMLPIVTGAYVVASVQDQHFPTPVRPSLRGPPAA